jgi:protocatechuate 3,4-dioxygenase beta subunit
MAGEWKNLDMENQVLKARIKELEAENKRMREALTEIWQLDAPGSCANIALDALRKYDMEDK